MNEAKFIQITASEGELYALDTEGNVWLKSNIHSILDGKWFKLRIDKELEEVNTPKK